MGKIGVKYLIQKGYDIVGAFGVNPKTLGADLGEVAGLGYPLGIKISSDLDQLLDETRPDIAVHAMYSTMADNEAVFTSLLSHGVNIVTTCDDSHYAWNLEPEVCRRLDNLAKQHNATLVGTGIQDVFFLHLGHVTAGAMVSLNSINLAITNNLDDYGITAAKGCGVGLTVEEFEARFKQQTQAQGTMTRPIAEAICEKFGLAVKQRQLFQVPVCKEHAIHSTALGTVIDAGKAIGIEERTVIETAEDVRVQCTYGLYIYDPNETDTVSWKLCGMPDYTVVVPGCKTPEGTMATLINRIPDAIEAPSGYCPDLMLTPAKFLHNRALTI